jgi:hypothetical protein
MRRAFKHTGVLMMVAVIGLTIIGAAYALWFENLTLTATVTTGTFNVDWSCENEVDQPVDCHHATEPVVSLDKGVTFTDFGAPPLPPLSKAPTCDAAISNSTGANDSNDAPTGNSNNVLTLTLGDLYPYAGCEFWINFHNAGTVPAHFTLTSVSLTQNGTPIAAAPWTIHLTTPNAACAATLAAMAAGQTPVELSTEGGPIQLHHDEQVICHFILALDQSASEGATFVFTAVIQAHQWNETP